VGYESAVDGPATLLVADDEYVTRTALEAGTDLDFALGERHCAGTFVDGRHVPCDTAAAPHCDAHTERWPCARCRGDCAKPIDACDEEHAVYLAAFAPDAFKVGVTRSWRLEERLREQGADRAVRIRTVEDGRRARQIEAGIATDVGDSVRVPRKVAGLHRSVDEAAWADLTEAYAVEARFDLDYGLDLDARPVADTLARGTVRGVKGRVLVLDRDGTTYAVDLLDLVGHEMTRGASGSDRQSSLGAF